MNRLFLVLLLVVVAFGAWLLFRADGGDAGARPTLRVARGSVRRVAVATGRVEPLAEVPVTSLTGGTVHELFVAPGQKVGAGEPLAEVRPVLTAGALLAAERAVKAARDAEEGAREFVEGRHLLAGAMRFAQGAPNLQRMYEAAVQGRERAEEQLRLLREGKVDVDGKAIDFVVRAPVAGHVLVLHVRKGDPVVPSSNFGSGTDLVTLADLGSMVFRGTVDEIDVGRLREGLEARVTLGALPGVPLSGRLEEIALRADSRDGAVVFGVRVAVDPPADVTLRAGLSAVAEIEVARADDVVVVPERVVRFRDGAAWVEVRNAQGEAEQRAVTLGLGDGLTVEVQGGLAVGDEVFEPVHAR